jgi:hypothetical protein
MGSYEYEVRHSTKQSRAEVYETIVEELRAHRWQIEEINDDRELRATKQGYYLAPRNPDRAPSTVKRLVSAASGMYGPIYIVLRNKDGDDIVTIVGDKNGVLQAAFVVNKKD